MLGQYGLFEEYLKHYTGDNKLDELYQLIATKKGQAISLDLYSQENWSVPVMKVASQEGEDAAYKEIARIEKEPEEYTHEMSQRPLVVFYDTFTTTKYGNPSKIIELLNSSDVNKIYEGQTRCAYQKPGFVEEYGVEKYKRPLSKYLSDKAINDDCDGIFSITVDFDSNIEKEEMEQFYTATSDAKVNKQRSLASYALAVETYALQLKEQLPFELQPTAIRFTGRGFQFIYNLAYTYFLNRDKIQQNDLQELFVKDTIMWLRRALEIENEVFYEDLGSCILPNYSFHLDKKFEQSIHQKRRVPGSYNDKSGMYAAYIYLSENLYHDRHTLQDLIDFCKENYRETYWAKSGVTKYIRKATKDFTQVESLLFAKSRLQALTKVVDERYKNGTLVGSRHNFLTQITNCIADIEKHSKGGVEPSYEQIFNKAIAFQVNHFKNKQLKQKEAISAIKGAMRRREKIIKRGDSTNLGNHVIIQFLDLTPEEEGVFCGTTRMSKRKAKAYENKISRAEKAVAAYQLREKGCTYEEIAELFAVSSSTAHRYVTELYPKMLKEKAAEIKAEKIRLKEQLRITQRFLYESVYERATRMIITREIDGWLKFWLYKTNVKKEETLSDHQVDVIVGLVLQVIHDSLFKSLRYAAMDLLVRLRKGTNNLVNQLIKNGSFKHILNEYTLLVLINNTLSKEQYQLLVNRVNEKLDILVQTMYWRHIEKMSSPKLKTFYPNGLLAKEYIDHEQMLPFPLFMTEAIREARAKVYGRKQNYTSRYKKSNFGLNDSIF